MEGDPGRAKTQEKLAQSCEKLKAAGLLVRPWGRAGARYLGLRGQLPPKPGPGETEHPQRPLSQQTIALKIPFTAKGVRDAEEFARVASLQVASREFSWTQWLGSTDGPSVDVVTFGDAIEQFRREWFGERLNALAIDRPGWTAAKRLETTQKTWDGYYKSFTSLLPLASPFAPATMNEVIKAIPADRALRNRACGIATRLAASQGLTYRPTELRTREKVPTPRNLPSDEMIETSYKRIRGDANKFIFGMLAAYGLRPHELYFIDPESLMAGPEALLKDGKTGGRIIYPFLPDWYEKFALYRPMLPFCKNLTTRSNSYLGKLIHERLLDVGFCDAGIEKIYDLRHAWAVRCIYLGVPDKIAADQMGHSVAIHVKTYQRWISKEIHRKEFERVRDRLLT